jgi:hypothetical protein
LQRDPKSLLWDAREAAEVIAAVTMGKSFADFDRDIVLRSAVERQFEIIGEARAPRAHRCRDGAESAQSAAEVSHFWPQLDRSSAVRVSASSWRRLGVAHRRKALEHCWKSRPCSHMRFAGQ